MIGLECCCRRIAPAATFLFVFGSLGLGSSATCSFAAPAGKTQTRSIADNMQTIMMLLRNHQKIAFRVLIIPGGVRTINTSKDPEIALAIQTHAADMKLRTEQGINVRPADRLFQELIRRHAEIKVRLIDIPGGVVEYETSNDPQVTLLIRAHTKIVAGFVRDGLPRAQESSPLPPGYHTR
jgi:hypothetical protein